MRENAALQRLSPLADAPSALRELQAETILMALPACYVVGIVLLVNARRLDDPLQGGWPAMMLFLLPVLVAALRSSHYLAAAWALVGGCLLVNLLIAAWAHVGAAVYLMALPAGLATLFVSVAAGVVTAGGCTLLLILAPAALVPDPALRLAAAVGVWGTVGLVWLTLRPFWTATQWYWSSYERSRQLLEQVRDSQVPLKQALADLEDANRQLTRLNRLAQGLRQVAEEARRNKQEFVANVSHELRTPLNMIIGFSEMILQAPQIYGKVPQKLLADLHVVLRNSQHLSRLIDDVLDLSQIEAGQVALTKEGTLIHQVVEAAMAAVRPLFGSKGLYLQAQIGEGLPPVFCDPTRVRQVVLNLLSNAGRFTEAGGVCVRAWREGESVVVSVADTGPGIPAEAREKVFQPFQQLDGSTRRRYGGSGLGLTISKRFIEMHDGRMWLESDEGKGSTFYFSLPIDLPAPASDDAMRWFSPYWHYEKRTRPSVAPVPVVRPRFVVLDEGHVLTRLLARYMHAAEVIPAASAQEAAQRLADAPARALLLNDLSPIAALDRLGEAALPGGTPVIICSFPGAHEAAGTLGVSDYLVKPVSRDALLAALDRLGPDARTILIVEDESEAAQLYRRILLTSGRGYRILTATDGEEALQVLADQPVDAILLDLVMPKMDGFQFLAERSRDAALSAVPIVVMSARDHARQPIVSTTLAVKQSSGLSLPQLLACIDAISAILSPPGQVGDPVRQGAPSG